ncbi:MAG: DUF805 domain-containing protein [Brevundimonas sp.]
MGERPDVRGEVLFYDETGGEGLISGDDGARYSFKRSELQHLTPVRAGARVDFVPCDTVASGVIVVPTRSHASYAGSPEADPISPWRYFTRCLSKYADGQGRARRKEYWYFVLFQCLILLVPLAICVALAIAAGDNPSDGYSMAIGLFAMLAGVIYLLLLIPGISVAIRRFHDVGLTGWLILLGLIPYVGGLATFIITLLPSQAYPNKHGPVPAWSKRATADVFS